MFNKGFCTNTPDCPSCMFIKDKDENVLNCVTWVMKLTCENFYKKGNWDEWQQSEYLLLDHCET